MIDGTEMIAALLTALSAGLLWRLRHERRRHHQTRADCARRVEQERATAERARQETRNRLLGWFDHLPEGVLVVDAEGRTQLANQALRRVFRLPETVIGRPVAEILPADELAPLWRQLRKGAPPGTVEITLPRLEQRVFEIHLAPLQPEGGRPRGAVLAFHDLTRMRRLEQARQDFVANVSHELRTPLSLIKGFVETLLDGAIENPEVAPRFLRNVAKHTDRLVLLIEDLLAVSRLESRQVRLDRRSVSPRRLTQCVFDDLESRARQRETRLFNQVAGSWRVFADPDRLQQVLWNLIENAIKYGRVGGRVTAGARRATDGLVEIWVRDDGPGIPREARPRLFERFYRADRARSRETGGTGLGLSIVKHIVQLHGGRVWVESAMQRGSTFSFTLPEADAPPPEETPADQP
jgi:two-component system phosphate regulon sensor histidine kinase PhoR